MYRLIYKSESIAISNLESGDAPMGCVSGLLLENGGTKKFAGLILELGGTEDDGEYRIELGEEFAVHTESGDPIPYAGGHILAYPEIDEALIDVVGIPYPEYEALFPGHVAEYERNF